MVFEFVGSDKLTNCGDGVENIYIAHENYQFISCDFIVIKF